MTHLIHETFHLTDKLETHASESIDSNNIIEMSQFPNADVEVLHHLFHLNDHDRSVGGD